MLHRLRPTLCDDQTCGNEIQTVLDILQVFYSTPYQVHYNSNRLGVRLNGPRPTWARTDGGGGGSHPSNVHDHTYAIGTINFTGEGRTNGHACIVLLPAY